MGVLIKNNQDQIIVSTKKIRKKAQVILDALDNPDAELSVMIVNDSQISKLNSQYLNRKGPTNVIAFPMQEGDFSGMNQNIIGDVVISAETAQKEGDQASINVEERMDQLLIHGILHLFKFDHESEEEALKMEKKSRKIMGVIKNI